MEEIFKPIAGYPGYFVSNKGRIMSKKRVNPVIMSIHKTRLGVNECLLWRDGKLDSVYLARTVLSTFIPYPTAPWLCYCHHINGNLDDCRLENLEWIVCETTDEYDPSKSHRKGVLKPDVTKKKMTESKYKQSRETIEKAVISRLATIETRKKSKKDNGK